MCEGRSRALKDIALISRCENMVLASPHTALGENAACTKKFVAKRANSVAFFWLAQLTLNLSQEPLSQHF